MSWAKIQYTASCIRSTLPGKAGKATDASAGKATDASAGKATDASAAKATDAGAAEATVAREQMLSAMQFYI